MWEFCALQKKSSIHIGYGIKVQSQVNIDGIREKIHEVIQLTLDQKADIIITNETKLTDKK